MCDKGKCKMCEDTANEKEVATAGVKTEESECKCGKCKKCGDCKMCDSGGGADASDRYLALYDGLRAWSTRLEEAGAGEGSAITSREAERRLEVAVVYGPHWVHRQVKHEQHDHTLLPVHVLTGQGCMDSQVAPTMGGLMLAAKNKCPQGMKKFSGHEREAWSGFSEAWRRFANDSNKDVDWRSLRAHWTAFIEATRRAISGPKVEKRKGCQHISRVVSGLCGTVCTDQQLAALSIVAGKFKLGKCDALGYTIGVGEAPIAAHDLNNHRIVLKLAAKDFTKNLVGLSSASASETAEKDQEEQKNEKEENKKENEDSDEAWSRKMVRKIKKSLDAAERKMREIVNKEKGGVKSVQKKVEHEYQEAKDASKETASEISRKMNHTETEMQKIYDHEVEKVMRSWKELVHEVNDAFSTSHSHNTTATVLDVFASVIQKDGPKISVQPHVVNGLVYYQEMPGHLCVQTPAPTSFAASLFTDLKPGTCPQHGYKNLKEELKVHEKSDMVAFYFYSNKDVKATTPVDRDVDFRLWLDAVEDLEMPHNQGCKRSGDVTAWVQSESDRLAEYLEDCEKANVLPDTAVSSSCTWHTVKPSKECGCVEACVGAELVPLVAFRGHMQEGQCKPKKSRAEVLGYKGMRVVGHREDLAPYIAALKSPSLATCQHVHHHVEAVACLNLAVRAELMKRAQREGRTVEAKDVLVRCGEDFKRARKEEKEKHESTMKELEVEEETELECLRQLGADLLHQAEKGGCEGCDKCENSKCSDCSRCESEDPELNTMGELESHEFSSWAQKYGPGWKKQYLDDNDMYCKFVKCPKEMPVCEFGVCKEKASGKAALKDLQCRWVECPKHMYCSKGECLPIGVTNN
eukprot:Platyproteum_vivax@DN6991_c0_g1_i10.p1